ncbi:hypothetical protein [Frondihabitans peucedani]|uniref:hypothetical protein n=1 Tax=Frondihabitans peucedani TaxID=598626 RepID=UPI0031DAF341
MISVDILDPSSEPRAFSVLYGLLVLESGAVHSAALIHLIVIAIAVSIVAHSSTDVPIAAAFSRMEKELPAPTFREVDVA